MERSIGQRFIGAFLVGGAIAFCTQIIMMVVGMVLPIKDLVPPVTLVVLGFTGMVLVLCGAYKKISDVGGFGAGIMFCGLVNAVANIFMGGAMEGGGKESAGMRAVAKFAVVVLGFIVVVGTVLGVLLAHTPGVLAAMDHGAAVAKLNPGMLVFLYAFLVGGLISIEGQVFLEFTPLPEPAVILGNAALGMALSIFGVSTQLEVLAGAGLIATVVDAGASAVLGGATLAIHGTPSRAIVFTLVMVLVVAMGIICGRVLLGRAKANRR